MAEESLYPCIACGTPAHLASYIRDGAHYYQGRCETEEHDTPESTNAQRARDFWQSWNATGGAVSESPEEEVLL